MWKLLWDWREYFTGDFSSCVACKQFERHHKSPLLKLRNSLRFFHKVLMKDGIPRKSIYRLSVYSRCLHRLRANQVEMVSSETLAHAAGVKSAQLRKDLTHLGNFGRRGIGYNVEDLLNRINLTMGTNRLLPVVLVGVGNLGAALLSYQGFAKEGFEIVAAFDVLPDPKRAKPGTVPLMDTSEMEPYIRTHNIRMAILTVPAQEAQAVTNQLVAAGIQGILNFAPVLLEVPEEVVANNVNLAIELENLAYFVR